jgi:hypothetical protein
MGNGLGHPTSPAQGIRSLPDARGCTRTPKAVSHSFLSRPRSVDSQCARIANLPTLDIFLALSKTSGDERTGHCKGLGPPGRARTCETAVCRGAQAHRFNRSTGASQFAPGGAADSRQLAVCGCRHRASRRGAGGCADADFQGPNSGHLSRRVMRWTAAVPTWKRLDESPGR